MGKKNTHCRIMYKRSLLISDNSYGFSIRLVWVFVLNYFIGRVNKYTKVKSF